MDSVFSTMAAELFPGCKLIGVLYQGRDEAALEMEADGRDFLFMAVELTGEERKMLSFDLTHTKGYAVEFLDKRYASLHDCVRNNFGFPPDFPIASVAEKAVIESESGKVCVIEYLSIEALSSGKDRGAAPRLRDGVTYKVDKKLTPLLRSAYPDYGKQSRTVKTAVSGGILFAVILLIILVGWGIATHLKQREPVLLANLVGERIEVAGEYLNKCGIGYTISEMINDEVERGIVLSQNVPAYTEVNAGGTIHLTVSAGRDIVASVLVETPPELLKYHKGDFIDPAGLVLRVVYESGEERLITSGYVLSPQFAEKKGDISVRVSWGEYTCAFTITVKDVELEAITVYKRPDKTEYMRGERLDSYGLKIMKHYSNGETELVERGFTCSPTVLDKSGVQSITVSYEGKTASFDVMVSD